MRIHVKHLFHKQPRYTTNEKKDRSDMRNMLLLTGEETIELIILRHRSYNSQPEVVKKQLTTKGQFRNHSENTYSKTLCNGRILKSPTTAQKNVYKRGAAVRYKSDNKLRFSDQQLTELGFINRFVPLYLSITFDQYNTSIKQSRGDIGGVYGLIKRA